MNRRRLLGHCPRSPGDRAGECDCPNSNRRGELGCRLVRRPTTEGTAAVDEGGVDSGVHAVGRNRRAGADLAATVPDKRGGAGHRTRNVNLRRCRRRPEPLCLTIAGPARWDGARGPKAAAPRWQLQIRSSGVGRWLRLRSSDCSESGRVSLGARPPGRGLQNPLACPGQIHEIRRQNTGRTGRTTSVTPAPFVLSRPIRRPRSWPGLGAERPSKVT
jgi:hypothetical protein